MQPKMEWSCDSCGRAIEDSHAALVTWQTDSENRSFRFRFVHKGKSCDTDRATFSSELADTVGVDGQAWWLHFLTHGPIIGKGTKAGVVDMDEFVDAFRRAQTPGYEQARPYFRSKVVQDAYADANEILPYGPDMLLRIAALGRVDEA